MLTDLVRGLKGVIKRDTQSLEQAQIIDAGTEFLKWYRVSREPFNEKLARLKLHLEITAEEGNKEGKLNFF